MSTSTVADVLNEREKTHGSFETHAEISQKLKRVLKEHGGKLNDVQTESLSMIFHKAARILNGDPSYRDHWVDIQGYAKLAEYS